MDADDGDGENGYRLLTIDTEEFIREIKENPCIWNYKSGAYGCKEERIRVWTELCRKFSDNYDEMDENRQSNISWQLQRKWKTLRDGFTRFIEQRRRSAPGSGPRSYVYYHHLSFLLKLCKRPNVELKNHQRKPIRKEKAFQKLKKNFRESLELEMQVDPSSIKQEFEGETLVQGSTTERSTPEATYITIDPLENQTTHAPITPQAQIPTNDFDEDKYFLLSLYKDFKMIPDECKLDARIDIIEVLKKYRVKVSK